MLVPLSHPRVWEIQTSYEYELCHDPKIKPLKKVEQELQPPRTRPPVLLPACFRVSMFPSIRVLKSEMCIFLKGPPSDPHTECRTTAFVQRKKKDINSLKLLVSVHWAGGRNHNSSVSVDPLLFYYRQYHFLLHGPAEGGKKQTRPRSVFICPWFYGSGCVQQMLEMQLSSFGAVFVLNLLSSSRCWSFLLSSS